MTRDEFVEQFLTKSGLSFKFKTATGFKMGKLEYDAVPCNCGKYDCLGWKFELPPLPVRIARSIA